MGKGNFSVNFSNGVGKKNSGVNLAIDGKENFKCQLVIDGKEKSKGQFSNGWERIGRVIGKKPKCQLTMDGKG